MKKYRVHIYHTIAALSIVVMATLVSCKDKSDIDQSTNGNMHRLDEVVLNPIRLSSLTATNSITLKGGEEFTMDLTTIETGVVQSTNYRINADGSISVVNPENAPYLSGNLRPVKLKINDFIAKATVNGIEDTDLILGLEPRIITPTLTPGGGASISIPLIVRTSAIEFVLNGPTKGIEGIASLKMNNLRSASFSGGKYVVTPVPDGILNFGEVIPNDVNPLNGSRSIFRIDIYNESIRNEYFSSSTNPIENKPMRLEENDELCTVIASTGETRKLYVPATIDLQSGYLYRYTITSKFDGTMNLDEIVLIIKFETEAFGSAESISPPVDSPVAISENGTLGAIFNPDANLTRWIIYNGSRTDIEVCTDIKNKLKEWELAGKTGVELDLYSATLPDDAFESCTSLKSVTLSKATTIGANAFRNCSNIQSIFLHKATNIGNNAFENCTTMSNVSMPSSHTIGSAILKGCTALTTLNLTCKNDITLLSDTFDGFSNNENCQLILNDNKSENSLLPSSPLTKKGQWGATDNLINWKSITFKP